MIVIAGLLILSSLGYVLAIVLQVGGVLQADISAAKRIIGVLQVGLWIVCAVSIVKRASWGLWFCLCSFAFEGVWALATASVPGVYGSAILEVALSVVFAAYVYWRRDYFMPTPRALRLN